MMITIDNLTVAANAPTGTTVGVLTARDVPGSVIPCNFALTKQAGGFFAISGNNLVSVWVGSIVPGFYPLRVRANGINTRFSSSATFIVTVAADQSNGPTPTGITFNPATASLSDDATASTTVAAISVSMSDASAFSGALSANPADTVAISGNTHLVLARALTTADDGTHQWGVAATQNGVTISGTLPVQVTVASPPPPPPSPPYPIAITVTPATSTIADNSPAGTLLATAMVTMSDGSRFTGAMTTSDTSFFAISGLNIVTARALTSADDGIHTTTITAHQGNQSVSVRLSI
jgi:hypothetical protein